MDKNLLIGGVVILVILTAAFFMFSPEDSGKDASGEIEQTQPAGQAKKMLGNFDVDKYPFDTPAGVVAEIAGNMLKSF